MTAAGERRDFETFWQAEVVPAIRAQERRRRENWKKGWPVVLLAAIAAGGTAYLFFASQGEDLDLAFYGALIATIGLGIWAGHILTRGLEEAGAKLAAKICRRFGLDYDRKPKGIPLARYRSLSLIPDYDRSSLEDHIHGAPDGFDLDIVEATLKERRTRHTKNGTRTYYVTVFDGLLLRADFHRQFEGFTILTRDKGAVLNWFKDLGVKGERVRLEDPRFEEVFEVFSDDQVEARYLLPPAIMERLLDIDERFGDGKMVLAFADGAVWLAIRRKGDQFSFGSVFAGFDEEKARAFVALLNELLETLRLLNSRAGGLGAGAKP